MTDHDTFESQELDLTESQRETTGSLVKGRYELMEELGRGGMGIVFRGRDVVLNREVVVKKLAWQGSSEAARRFHSEARSAGRLSHPNTIAVLDFGQTEDGDLFLVMELIKGKTLATLIEERGALPLDMVLNLFSLLLGGLAHAHERGIVHRDIKPSNIFLAETETGLEPKLMDFGISRLKAEEQHITQTGVAIGSPQYVSPEQARGLHIDERTDIYSMGCTMFECLTGVAPFDSDQVVTTVFKHINEAPPLLADVAPDMVFSEALETLISKCLEKDVNKRYQTAEELRDAVRALRNESETLFSPDNSQSETVHVVLPVKKIRPAFRIGIVLLLLSGVLGFVAFSFNAGKEEVEAEVKHIKRDRKLTEGRDSFTILLHEGGRTDVAIRDSSDLREIDETTKYVRLMNTECKPELFKRISECKNISTIEARNTPVDDDALKLISTLPELETLKIKSSRKLTDEGIAYLARLPKLECLELQDTNIGDKALRWIRTMPNLRLLNLEGNKNVSDAGVIAISEMPKMESLNLCDTSISDKSLDAICGMKRLKLLHLGNCAKLDDNSLKIVSRIKKLLVLDVSGTRITDRGLLALEPLKMLRRIDVSSTGITDKGLQNIVNVMGARLSVLNVANTRVTKDGIKYLVAAKGLKLVSIRDLHLGDEGLEQLGNVQLKAASIVGNDVTIPGVIRFISSQRALEFLQIDSGKVAPLKEAMVEHELNNGVVDETYHQGISVVQYPYNIGDGIK